MSEYLPRYARRADRSRLVKLLCKGRCSCVRWAEMNVDYPVRPTLRYAQVGEFTAVSLKCSKIAMDPYNWIRP